MIVTQNISFNLAIKALRAKGIIAYPTEAVWGLGCCPYNRKAVERILTLKQRDIKQGLIIIAADLSQLKPLLALEQVSDEVMQSALDTWPGPYTWLFPASSKAPAWITGTHSSVAVRLTAHPVARQICLAFGGAIISTSANIAGGPPAKTQQQVIKYFPTEIDIVVPGMLGGAQQPSAITDVLTKQKLR